MQLNLIICKAVEAAQFVRANEQAGTPIDAVISIEHPCDESTSLEKGRAPRLAATLGDYWRDRQLILTCWDIEEAVGGTPAPDAQIARDGLTHYKKWRPASGFMNLLVHCRSGKARSTAMGLVVLSHIYGEGREERCVEELLAVRPIAAPNLAIVRHGDHLLGRRGALVRAVEENDGISRRRVDANIARARQIESLGFAHQPNP